jgi:hypothetical protein
MKNYKFITIQFSDPLLCIISTDTEPDYGKFSDITSKFRTVATFVNIDM